MQRSLYFNIYAICIYTIATTTAVENCSATNAYIKQDGTQTLLSAQALWPPFSYYIPPTQLVKLSNNDNICSGELTTDISNKIVLIMPADGSCTYITRAYNAQENGAKAVIIGNDEKESGDVEEIPNENTNLITTIPTRMTTYTNGDILATALDGGQQINIEFTCDGTSNMSLVLCFIDESGDHWYLDGDYQLQVGLTTNDHPVWRKNGYLLVMDADYYLYLHSGTQSMYWAITEDPSMMDDTQIVAKCSSGGIDNPMLCPSWFTTESGKKVSTKENTFTLNENIKINDTLCEITDNYICIRSTQSQLAGLYGTYRQFNAKAPYWFREWVDCDTQPGYLTFVNYGESGVFWLIDPFDYWVVAECEITGSPQDMEDVAFHPELCEQWNSLVDGSLDAKYKVYDDSMKVIVNECGEYECPNDVSRPNKLCMTRNNVMHSFLEGGYELTGVRGNKWNTSEWKRTNKLYYNGEYIPVFVWYYGEIHQTLNWWVIAMDNLTTAIANNGSSVYGYCPSNTLSPSNCLSCWNFYFSGDERAEGAWHSDCTFDMTPMTIYDTDSCEIDNKLGDIKIDWPEYLCVNDVLLMTDNATFVYRGDVNFNYVMGGYIIDEHAGGNGIPIWRKPANNYINNETYIYYDKFYGYWQIGYDMSDIEGAVIMCMEDKDEYLPTQCDTWYDTDSNIIGNLLLYSDGCSKEDVMYRHVTHEKDDTKIIIIVLIILGLVACFIAGFFYYKNQTKGQGTGFERTNRRHNSGDIELGDDVDQLNLKTNETIKGGFDMSPLNVDPDDDDDDITIDAQQHDVVDDHDDDEEQLIGGNGMTQGNGKKESDPDLRMPDTDEDDEDEEDEDEGDNEITEQ